MVVYMFEFRKLIEVCVTVWKKAYAVEKGLGN